MQNGSGFGGAPEKHGGGMLRITHRIPRPEIGNARHALRPHAVSVDNGGGASHGGGERFRVQDVPPRDADRGEICESTCCGCSGVADKGGDRAAFGGEQPHHARSDPAAKRML